MNKIIRKTFIGLALPIMICGSRVWSQESRLSEPLFYKHSVETSPISPFLQMAKKGIWGIKYEYAITPKDELKAGLAYMNLHFEEGTTNSPGLIIGYRRFVWKKLYLEYELWPAYDEFYEKNESKYYKSFDLWNEFRVGYQINFTINQVPLFVNIAWPFGFGLYSSNKPDSFYDRMNQSFNDKYFFQFPLLFTGFKF
ncbi:MAG TPA: hypothetical protein VJ937_11315 [Salinivirga sp.]|uniref:hypothetical protein n=1 Tax=Salinivirga sp. TaxID=1970192 RepID=UPI002B470740|nr:hypothetical protein [Salinivirga sp.]HKK60061.1 hypothetical protein [Salinivirga sp.]